MEGITAPDAEFNAWQQNFVTYANADSPQRVAVATSPPSASSPGT